MELIINLAMQGSFHKLPEEWGGALVNTWRWWEKDMPRPVREALHPSHVPCPIHLFHLDAHPHPLAYLSIN